MSEEKKFQTGVFVNENDRQMVCQFAFDGTDHSLRDALGDLELASDILKNKFSEWRMQDLTRKGILVPKNGNGQRGFDVR